MSVPKRKCIFIYVERECSETSHIVFGFRQTINHFCVCMRKQNICYFSTHITGDRAAVYQEDLARVHRGFLSPVLRRVGTMFQRYSRQAQEGALGPSAIPARLHRVNVSADLSFSVQWLIHLEVQQQQEGEICIQWTAVAFELWNIFSINIFLMPLWDAFMEVICMCTWQRVEIGWMGRRNFQLVSWFEHLGHPKLWRGAFYEISKQLSGNKKHA